MKTSLFILALSVPALLIAKPAKEIQEQAGKTAAYNAMLEKSPYLFIENKGQLADQYGSRRNDIDYKLETPGITVFVGEGQLHYQWLKPNETPYPPEGGSVSGSVPGMSSPIGDKRGSYTAYRMDVVLLGANKNAEVIAENKQGYYENYYLPQCPGGVVAQGYKKITYKNIYPNIDWVLYIENGERRAESGLKYDFVVHPGGNVADIQLRYEGAGSINIENGTLVAVTPMGSVTEQAPYSYEAGTGKMVASAFSQQGDIIGFSIGSYTGSLVIDPAINMAWATYYGGSGDESASIGDYFNQKFHAGAITTDVNGDVCIGGATASTGNIATTGAFQTTLSGTEDAFIVKFSGTGQRLWATYYGGAGVEGIKGATCDAAGNLYFAGSTTSTGLATSGAHQSSFGGLIDGLVMKFSSSGSRLWASYYGGIDTEVVMTVVCDASGNVIIGGGTQSTAGIASSGAYQANLSAHLPIAQDHATDAFLVKFNGSGQRLWSTYYGGNMIEYITSIACDNNGNLYATGFTTSTTGISSSGAHQTVYGGDNPSSGNDWGDGFLVKFSSSGTRQWATYYGGTDIELINAVHCDRDGTVYIGGMTNSPYSANVISTAGSYLQSPALAFTHGFYAKFNGSGVRQYGTYVAPNTYVKSIKTDRANNVYVGGKTMGNFLPATPGCYQAANAGNFDAILMLFSAANSLLYATYYGGTNFEFTCNMELSHTGRVFLSGFTMSTTGIATAGSHQTVYGGAVTVGYEGDAYLASFIVDTMVYFKLPFTDTLFCAGDSVHIRYGVNTNFRAGNIFTLQLSDKDGNFTNAVNIGTRAAVDSGTIHGRIPLLTGKGSGYRLRIISTNPVRTSFDNDINIRIKPVAGNFLAGNNTPICEGDTLKLTGATDSAGTTWLWTGPNSYSSQAEDSNISAATPSMSGQYILTAIYDGCTVSDTETVLVKPLPAKPIANSNTPLCPGTTLNLSANTSTGGVSYSWTGPVGFSTTTQNPNRPNVITAWSGDYIVSAILNGCATKDTVTVLIHPVTPAPVAGNNSPVCIGGDINLSATTVAGATYNWSGPGLYSSTQQNAVRGNAQTTHAGVYSVTATANGCVSAPATTTVSVVQGPEVLMYPNPGDSVCPGWNVTFVAVPKNAGGTPTYQWYKNGIFTGATNVSYPAGMVNDGDTFYVKMTAGTACNTPISSKPLRMTVLPVHTPPTISITNTPGTHVWPHVEVTFKASTGNAGAHPGYQWRRNGKDIANAKDSILKLTDLKTGDTICCVVTSNFLCAEPREVQSNCIVMNVDLSVEKASEGGNGINLYPNPNKGAFTVEVPEEATLYITNVQGQHISTHALEKGKNNIQIQHAVCSGLYFAKVVDKNGYTSVVRIQVN